MKPSEMRKDFENAVEEAGTTTTIKYWNIGSVDYSGTDYDEEYYPVGSATSITCAGLMFPVRGDMAGEDYKYLEQGTVQVGDSKLFVPGSVDFNNNALITYGGNDYKILEGGVVPQNISGVNIFKKVFVRLLAGSPSERVI
jgi:hypothetical protein